MKFLFGLGALVCMFSSSAFAFQKVQFDYSALLYLCPMDKPDGTCSDESLGPSLVHDTVVVTVDPDSALGSAGFSKTLSLRRVWGAAVDIDLSVSFSKDIIDRTKTNVIVSLTPTRSVDPQGVDPNVSETSVTVDDLSHVTEIYAPGKMVVMKMADGPNLSMEPVVTVSNIKVLE